MVGRVLCHVYSVACTYDILRLVLDLFIYNTDVGLITCGQHVIINHKNVTDYTGDRWSRACDSAKYWNKIITRMSVCLSVFLISKEYHGSVIKEIHKESLPK